MKTARSIVYELRRQLLANDKALDPGATGGRV